MMTKQEALKQVEDLLGWEEPKPKNLIAELLKEHYSGFDMKSLVYSKNVFIDLIEKGNESWGKQLPVNIVKTKK